MKLNDKEFARFKELKAKEKKSKLTPAEESELAELIAKREKGKDEKKSFTPGNDFSWWNKIPELLKDSANFKCNWIPGTAMASGRVSEVGVGVVGIELVNCLGVNVDSVDPINTWARDLYLRMFQKYRPASNYTAADLGITIIAGIEAVKLIAYYERIYGIINRYSRLNINMPDEEADMLGLTPLQLTYLQGHLSDFRYDLNFLIRKAQRLCVPKDLSAVAQAISLFGYEYMDHESIRSQFILFTLKEYGVYSDTQLSSGGSIHYNNTLTTDLFDFSADNMCKALNTVLNALLGSDSVQRICADLVVWFGQASMLEFQPLPEDYIVVPVKSESILHEIHNLETPDGNVFRVLSFADGMLDPTDAGIVAVDHYLYQVDDRIVTAIGLVNVPGGSAVTPTNYTINGRSGQIGFSSGGAVTTLDPGHILDTYHDDITLENVVEGCVFKFSATNATDTNGTCAIIDTAGFYIATCVRNKRHGASSAAFQTINAGGSDATAGQIANLDWAPLCMNYNSGTKIVTRVFGDYDNVVVLAMSELERVQRTMILSGLHTDMHVVTK